MNPLESQILELTEQRGPLTGSEILQATGEEGLLLWRTCKQSPVLSMVSVGTRYLRLDRRIDGFARLSPSILREFLTYTVIGPSHDRASLLLRSQKITSHIEEVSRAKSQLAYTVVAALADRFEHALPLHEHVSFIIAGDIVYNMAHDVPRPERSTGRLVKGSDVDLVVVVDPLFPKDLTEKLDEAIFYEKSRLLVTPHLQEEIDYIVKDVNRVTEQLQFDSFKHMVACKILHEGTLLYGSDALFQWIKRMLKEYGVHEKLRDMEKASHLFRRRAEEYLLTETLQTIKESDLSLFYPVEESEEFSLF
jgi:predicted nucleotidyltransferase